MCISVLIILMTVPEPFIKTNQQACPWHRAGSVQRRRWHHRVRRVAGFPSARIGQISRSSHNTSRSRPDDCTQWSSYGPVKYQADKTNIQYCILFFFFVHFNIQTTNNPSTHMHGRSCIWLYTLKHRGRNFTLIGVTYSCIKNKNMKLEIKII